MAWFFTQDKAVYLQIAERITILILSGKYAPSEQIPSVRQLALEAAVNPNTVQHAFSELENQNIIVSKGTLGRFVTDDVEVIEKCRKRLAEKYAAEFITKASALSLQKDELISIIKETAL